MVIKMQYHSFGSRGMTSVPLTYKTGPLLAMNDFSVLRFFVGSVERQNVEIQNAYLKI
jgi:hypothetical protein